MPSSYLDATSSIQTQIDSKVPSTRSISTTAPLSGGGDLSSNRTLTCDVASGSQPGCLASADWTTFNNKQAALPLTTKGDILTRDGSGYVRFPVCADGEAMVADAAETSGWKCDTPAGVTDHGGLTGLSDDDHTQYFLLGGRSGGQTAKGGTASGDDLTISSTDHATKGNIFFGSSTFDEANERLGINTTSPEYKLHLRATADDYAHGFAMSHSLGGANALTRFYQDLNGNFSIGNPNNLMNHITWTPQGQAAMADQHPTSHGATVGIRTHNDYLSRHTLALTKKASQTGKLLDFQDTDYSSLASVDVAGAAIFSGVTDSSKTAGSVLFSGTSGLHSQDNTNFFWNDTDNRLGIGVNSSLNSRLSLKAPSTNTSTLSLISSGGAETKFMHGSSSGDFWIEQGCCGQWFTNISGNFSIVGTRSPKWSGQMDRASTQTTLNSFFDSNTGDPVFAVVNSNGTANNLSGLAFVGNSTGTTQADSGVYGKHVTHTGGSETGVIGLAVRKNGGTMTSRLEIDGDGVVTLSGYGAGVVQTDSTGVVSSSAVDLATSDVTGVLPAANVGLGRTINAQTGTTYTFVLSDGQKAGANTLVTGSNASAQTFTVPPNSSVAYPTGDQIDVCQVGAGKLTLAQGSGVTINSKSSNKAIGAQYVCVSLVKTATDTWLLIGDLIAQVLDLLGFKMAWA